MISLRSYNVRKVGLIDLQINSERYTEHCHQGELSMS